MEMTMVMILKIVKTILDKKKYDRINELKRIISCKRI